MTAKLDSTTVVQQPEVTMFDLDEFMGNTLQPAQLSNKSISPMPFTDTTGVRSSSEPSNSPQTPVSTRAQNLMMQYHDYRHHYAQGVPQPTADDGHHYLDCPKVWERIVTHPRFDEVDLEALCVELNAKVKIV
jgi:hypothetical protein